MQYLIGANVYDKLKKVSYDVYTCYSNKNSFPAIIKIDEINSFIKDEELRTILYDNVEDAQKELSKIAKNFHPKQYILKFYLLKVQSSKMPFKFEKINNMNKNQNQVYKIVEG